MQIAIISDIHGNLEALTQAFKVIDQLGVTEVYCLGDIVGYGSNPNECVDLVRSRCSMVIMGNHDQAVNDLEIVDKFSEVAREAIIWTAKNLNKRNLTYLNELPYTMTQDNLLFVHASPVRPDRWTYLFTIQQAMPEFDAFDENICFVGHTHTPRVFSNSPKATVINKEYKFIINVGSVGQPRDGDPRVSFGIFDTETWDYKNIRTAYEIDTAADKIMQNGLPVILAERLRRGR